MNKTLLFAAVAVLGIFPLLSACQNGARKSNADFDEKTHRTYNPETGTFEQQPPYGKQSNKSGTIAGS